MEIVQSWRPIIRTKTLAATGTLGKRVKAAVINCDGTTGAHATYQWDYRASADANHSEAARSLFETLKSNHRCKKYNGGRMTWDWVQGTLSVSPLVCAFIRAD